MLRLKLKVSHIYFYLKESSLSKIESSLSKIESLLSKIKVLSFKLKYIRNSEYIRKIKKKKILKYIRNNI